MYVFIGGGMGITPFRSIIKQHLEKKVKLNATLFYFVSSQQELLFQDVFEKAVSEVGMVFIPILTSFDSHWSGQTGKFSEAMLKKNISLFENKQYYLSGSESFINAVREILQSVGIPEEQIKTDIFSGY